MEKKNWTDWDKIVWGSVLAVVEGVIVYQIVGLNGACNLLNLTVLPCWGWALIVWSVSALATYYVFVKGAFWLLPKLRDEVKLYYYRLKNGRDAKLMVFSVIVEGEYYIAVHNDEFFFRADDIVVNSKFINIENKRINGNIKWDNHNSKIDTVSIPRKKHKILHVATISNDKLIFHLSGGDEVFPFPNTINSYYVIPLFISGSMSFLSYKIKRIRVAVNESIYIYNDRKAELRWQREKNSLIAT